MANTDKMSTHKDTPRHNGEPYETLAKDLQQLRDDFKMLRDDLGSASAAGVKNAKKTVKEGYASTEEQAREAMEAAATEFQDIKLKTKEAVRETPLTAVFAALAVGFVAGGLLRK